MSLWNSVKETTNRLFFLKCLTQYPEYETWRQEVRTQARAYCKRYKIEDSDVFKTVLSYFYLTCEEQIKEAQKSAFELLNAKLKYNRDFKHLSNIPGLKELQTHVKSFIVAR